MLEILFLILIIVCVCLVIDRNDIKEKNRQISRQLYLWEDLYREIFGDKDETPGIKRLEVRFKLRSMESEINDLRNSLKKKTNERSRSNS